MSTHKVLTVKRDSRYPEHDKLTALGERREGAQQMLDFLMDAYVLAAYIDTNPEDENGERERRGGPQEQLLPAHRSREQLMADCFGISMSKLETEKRAMLDELRSLNASTPTRGSRI